MLLDWINDELAEQRIIVKDLEEDMFDGQILQKLLGKEWILVTFKKSYFSQSKSYINTPVIIN